LIDPGGQYAPVIDIMQLTLKTLLIHFGISACLAQGGERFWSASRHPTMPSANKCMQHYFAGMHAAYV